jgi:glucose-6-phosphate 1-dehydrogenase
MPTGDKGVTAMNKGNTRGDDIQQDPAVVKCTVPGADAVRKVRLVDKKQDPCTIVIFGASGDLTRRKLVPALYRLYAEGGLPDSFLIVGTSRTDMSHEHFRDRMKNAVPLYCDIDRQLWDNFAGRLFYKTVDYQTATTYVELGEFLVTLEREYNMKGNRIYNLAIPPSLYKTTIRMLGEAGLSDEEKHEHGWLRVVIEKPFGRDLKTALELNQTLQKYFHEHQVFRIDHYLAKETVQSILMFRFANSIFEPVWNRNYIGNISIIAAESLGVEHRAGYYEEAGVLRDMFQNHMMQLLAVTAMEPPSLFEAERVRDERVKLFRSMRPFSPDNHQENVVLGQYTRGVIDGEAVPAYREEEGIPSDSLTPTFAMMKVLIDNWRWQGVPFYMTSGKRMVKKLTEIIINFKEVPHSLFRSVLGEHITANRLIMGIQPDERITLTFQTKHPGAHVSLRSVTMNFSYLQDYSDPVLDAYEKVLLDVIGGDHMLFWRQDGLEMTWAFLTPVLDFCETCADRDMRLHFYKSGSWGPEAVHDIMRLHVKDL